MAAVSSKKTILVVEDDDEVRLLLEHVLRAADYAVDSVEGATAALRLLAERTYALVLADARLADGTGLAVADAAQSRGFKALIVTGYGLSLPPETAPRYDFLLKPVRPSELLNAVIHRIGASGNGS